MAAKIKAGTVMLNDAISCFGIAEAPHGGFKQSGIGRTHGEMGLQEMVQTKYIDVDLVPGCRRCGGLVTAKNIRNRWVGLLTSCSGKRGELG